MTSNTVAKVVESEFMVSDHTSSLLSLLNPIFPEPEVTPQGFSYFMPEDVARFDALFERFGLEFRSSSEAFEDFEYVANLWYRLSEGYGTYITCSFLQPSIFKKEMAKWPPDFRDYLKAVIENDQPAARLLAKKLQVENLNAYMPKAFFG